MELVDTHCHLTEPPLASQLDLVLDRARKRGVNHIIAPAYDHASWPQVAALVRHVGVSRALGIHPWVAAEGIDASGLERALRDVDAVAIGEIGLDFKLDHFDRAVQIETLCRQLDLAVVLDLPVILHCRGAFEELLAIVKERSPRLRGVVHAFSRGPKLAQRLIDLGLHIALGGAVTRPGARAAKAAKNLPLDCLLLETDAPSIGLFGVRPENTEPHHVADVAAQIALLRGIDVRTVAQTTTENALRLFGLA